MSIKQHISEAVSRYFDPLTKRWFWYYVFPAIVIFSMVMAYLEVYHG